MPISCQREVCSNYCSISAFIVQGLGGSVASGTEDDLKTIQLGLHIYTGGIAAQQLFVLIFICMVIFIYRKLDKEGSVSRQKDWRPLLRLMLIALALITVRLGYLLFPGNYSRIPQRFVSYTVLSNFPMDMIQS